MNERVAAAFAVLPEYLAWHVLLSASALVLGIAISLPLAVAASRSARLRWPVLALASLIQTIPSLALLALFYPLLLAISSLSVAVFGKGFSALGFLPSLLALTLYSMLPILRNGAAGILGVDPAIIEAADGVGMTPRQRLFQVELPLAAPVIMAGVRTAAVWTIGAATLSTPVGQTSLGNYIFAGLQTENWVFVLFGCAASAALALVADQLLGLVESGAADR
ncbi:MAG: substrate-binding region of ABC-type glycine betaine transport system, partial [Phenylobacterium sp.]|nr:substrate-binding region of ABC-type glycine betaine transport system [Phenylobacterium sp.]